MLEKLTLHACCEHCWSNRQQFALHCVTPQNRPWVRALCADGAQRAVQAAVQHGRQSCLRLRAPTRGTAALPRLQSTSRWWLRSLPVLPLFQAGELRLSVALPKCKPSRCWSPGALQGLLMTAGTAGWLRLGSPKLFSPSFWEQSS